MSQQRIEPQSFDWKSMTPDDSPRTLPEIMTDPLITDLRTPKMAAGDVAFDFELPVYDFSDGIERPTAETMHLSRIAAERPVALIFGSYT